MRIVGVFYVSDAFEEDILSRTVNAAVCEKRQFHLFLFRTERAVRIDARDDGSGVFAEDRTDLFDLLFGGKDSDA